MTNITPPETSPMLAHVICGPTACGKDDAAFDMAQKHNKAIIGLDSMKIFRGMDIGTDKPSALQRESVDYHMIDILEPHETFDVSQYVNEVDLTIKQLNNEGQIPIIAGGTFLYLRSLLFGLFDGPAPNLALRGKLQADVDANGSTNIHQQLAKVDPISAKRLHPNDAKRIIRALEVFDATGRPLSEQQQQMTTPRSELKLNIIPLTRDRDLLYERINDRVETMIRQGLIAEVQAIHENKGFSQQALNGVGYNQVVDYLDERLDYDTMIYQVQLKSRHLAKHQLTWMNNMDLDSPIDTSIIKERDNVLHAISQRIELFENKNEGQLNNA